MPLIKNKYSNDDFIFKSNNCECINGALDGNVNKLLYDSPSGSNVTYCDQSNFENSEEILGKCNLKNKNLLTEVCTSYATPIGNVGYPYKCSIDSLNQLTQLCNEYDDLECKHYSDTGCIKTYPAAYPIKNGAPIPIGGVCSNHGVISREMDSISDQTITNQEVIEEHNHNAAHHLNTADTMNVAHIVISAVHEDNLAALEEKSEDTTKMRICNARKRKYDFKTKSCTDDFIEFSIDDTNPDYYKCEQDRIDSEQKGKIKLYLYFFVFLIILFLCCYIIFLR